MLVSGFTFYYDLFVALFLQSWFFVMFNKVVTAQYYMWYMAFWPVVLVNNRLMHDRFQHFTYYLVVWALGQAVWGYYANAFENQGEQTLVQI